MTEEEFFVSNYPDSCYGDKPLSPHWDFFQDGVQFGERQSDEKIQELEKENAELKTKKIPQLERRIASIRGSHSVDVKKLNARIEQVERLKKENAELKSRDCWKSCEYANPKTELIGQHIKDVQNLTKAKEIIKKLISDNHKVWVYSDVREEAEQFLKENEE